MSMNVETVSVMCPECGFQFWPSKAIWDTRGITRDPVFCPHGHKVQPPYPSELAKAQSEAKRATESKEYWERRFNEERACCQRMARRINGLRGYIAQLKEKLEAKGAPRP